MSETIVLPTSEKTKNTVETETDKARYRIIYGIHHIETDPATLENLDGVVLEMITPIEGESGAKLAVDFLKEKVVQYRRVLKYCQQHGIPLFLADLSYNVFRQREYDSEMVLKEVFLPVIEAILGLVLITSSATKTIQQKGISRREFIKQGLKGLVGVYCLMPQINKSLMESSQEPDERSRMRRLSKQLERTTKAMHPEMTNIIMAGRNDLLAQKSETIASTMRTSNHKPNLGIIIGAAHTGIEDSLQAGEQKRITKLKKAFGNNGLSVERNIARLDFPDPNSAEIQISIFQDDSLVTENKN